MVKCYQYTADGYFAGEVEDYGLLPNNATYMVPTIVEGFVPRWTGKNWEQVEDHKGKNGYVNGVLTEIKEYGPLPEGWSDAPPPLTYEELAEHIRAERNIKIAETDYLVMPDYPISVESEKAIRKYRQDLRDITMQGEFPHKVNWPEMPEIH